MMGREGTGWPRSSIMGSVCFAKIALMLSEPLKGKRTQKTMQICMRLVKVERERWTNPRYEAELTQPSGLTLRVRGRESGPTARRFAASKAGRWQLQLIWARLGKDMGSKTSP